MSKEKCLQIYEFIVVLLAICSIILVLLDFSNTITLYEYPYNILDFSILSFFWTDYVIRFIYAKNKLVFFKSNIFDLIAILPFDAVLSVFRSVRILRIFRIIGFGGLLYKKFNKFITTNALHYTLTITIVVIIFAAELYSNAEHVTFTKSLWWAVVTATTVGYGDIAPVTEFGKCIAVILMIAGIGLLGSFTSSVTSFFMHNNSDNAIKKELQILHEKIKNSKSIPDEIRKYKDLYDEGIISKQEFDIKKDNLLKKDDFN